MAAMTQFAYNYFGLTTTSADTTNFTMTPASSTVAPAKPTPESNMDWLNRRVKEVQDHWK